VSEHLGDQLSALLDGALDSNAMAAAGAHLAECPACAHELEVISASRGWLRQLPDVDPPLGFYEGMLTRHRRRMPIGVGVLAVGAAAALSFAVLPQPAHTVKPVISPLVQDHVVSASMVDDPIAQLTSVAIPTTVPTTATTLAP
jgi:anti-sigma factor RsiW